MLLKKQLQQSIFYDYDSGGGIYNDYGMKNGKWRGIFDNYREHNELLIDLETVKSFKQVWELEFHLQILQFFKFSQNRWRGIRDGVWLELNDNFSENCHKNGYKQGRWKALFKGCHEYTYKTLGGGVYQEDGLKMENGQKYMKAFQKFLVVNKSC
ncbi:unnamed protein product (macronuclear) [Paramecium tetraurelia]|uniref:Uncharacterized protein n=1 Tax=Paramecium tetraurelia TaxID=5888 RepID=A0D4M0_PARTE|nr:uncharacterized protein GSPATT00013434001 [Paramecium tetraurelia]CAK77987.1 unnamed protein product [Paramecium tetraurelia]|eukprot:XP_001445384.1 hypothetical protein (macronuclear) [Paramecium tetraurelia strain d4-2]